MSNALKYIEILSIEQVEDKYYLQIALHANEVTKVYWQIDEVTYENLYLQCDFSGSYRYRLSFKIIENALINKLVGRITRTYLTNSSMIDFQTTKAFKEQLQLIRFHSQTNTLYQLPFIQHNLHEIYVVEPVQEVDATSQNAVVAHEGTEPSSDSEANATSSDVDGQAETINEIDASHPIEVSPDETEAIAIQTDEKADDSIVTLEEVGMNEIAQQAQAEPVFSGEQTDELQEVVADSKLAEQIESEVDEEEQNKAAIPLTDELEETYLTVSEKDFANGKENNLNQATTLVKLMEENNEELTKNEALASENMPIQTILTLPTIEHSPDEASEAVKEEMPVEHEAQVDQEINEVQQDEVITEALEDRENTDVRGSDVKEEANEQKESAELQQAEAKEEVQENTDAKDDAVVIQENAEVHATTNLNSSLEDKKKDEAKQNIIHEQSTEKTNSDAEVEKIAEPQMLSTETVMTEEPVERTSPLNEQPKEELTVHKQEAEEKQHALQNKIAFITVALAVIIAVSIYLLFFQQTTNVLNTEAAANTTTSNTVTYNIEESFTFSLPKNYVALTFNRGPSPYTLQILDLLNQYHYGATFFLQGNQVPLYPDIVKTIDANGHAIGHITDSHSLLTILEVEEQREALIKPKDEIEQLLNKETLLVRPPFNSFNQNTISIQQEYDLKIVNSSIVLKSGNDVQADTIMQAFNEENLEGAIIGLDESQATVEALPTILEKIKKSNLQVVILQ